MLEIHNLNVKKDGITIIENIQLTLKQGEIHSLLGRNGTGKSTLAYAVMGLQNFPVSSGKLIFNGKDITQKKVSERARMGITLAWQEPARFEGLTVFDYMQISKQNGNENISVEECLNLVGLDPQKYLDRQLDTTLSGGERKRIELASVLAMNPKLAILDEPDSGIDALSINFIKEVISKLKMKNSTVLLITHHEEVAEMSDRSSVLCGSKLLKTGKPEVVSEFYRKHCEPCYHVNKPKEEAVYND
ncbi:MAG: ABC transporter ATP-binding protein [Kosmotoga sp.]|nr:MAG: ABC transporter ATP-binding protein [Kosmotoga sp.]